MDVDDDEPDRQHHVYNNNNNVSSDNVKNGIPNTTSTGTTSTLSVLSLPLPPRAAQFLSSSSTDSAHKHLYWDRSHYDSPASQLQALKQSKTVYVGNLAFTTRSRQVRAHFGMAVSSDRRAIRAIHMGLDRLKKTPCGFCFVEFSQREDALAAVAHVSGTKLDGKVIRVELDAGFQPGRQYGRGVSGGQVRDDKAKQQQQHHQRGSIFSSLTMDRKRPRAESTSHHSSSSSGAAAAAAAGAVRGGGEGLPVQGENRGDHGEHQEAARGSFDAGQENPHERERGSSGGGDHSEDDDEPAAKRRRM